MPRAGLIAPDETTYEYIMGRPKAPKGAAWEAARAYWETLYSDDDAEFDTEVKLDAAALPPLVTWGTSPENVVTIDGKVPNPYDIADANKRRAIERALDYMGLTAGTPIKDITIDRVFLGSCTNGRIEDLRAAAKVIAGHKVKEGVNAMVVPGSGLVKEQAEAEGLDKVFLAAGFEWREPGCSMCLAMNADRLAPGERCASTSNRNFEGRQGFKGRTHLVSPAMAAAAAIAGRFVDIREWPQGTAALALGGAAHIARRSKTSRRWAHAALKSLPEEFLKRLGEIADQRRRFPGRRRPRRDGKPRRRSTFSASSRHRPRP